MHAKLVSSWTGFSEVQNGQSRGERLRSVKDSLSPPTSNGCFSEWISMHSLPSHEPRLQTRNNGDPSLHEQGPPTVFLSTDWNSMWENCSAKDFALSTTDHPTIIDSQLTTHLVKVLDDALGSDSNLTLDRNEFSLFISPFKVSHSSALSHCARCSVRVVFPLHPGEP